MQKSLLTLALFSFLLCTGVRAQTTYYVAKSGDNNSSGTSLAEAWETIRYGIDNMAPGDTLLVDDGLYVETDLLIPHVSTADKWTVVKSINQWGAKIEGTTQYNTILGTDNAAYVVIDGFEVFNLENRPFADWNPGIQAQYSHHVLMQNNYVHDCGCGGVTGRESDYITIRRNVARDNAKTNPYNCSGINIFSPIAHDDAPGVHILIQENVTFENECRLPFEPGGFDIPTDGNGIILDEFDWTYDPDMPAYTAATLVENNLAFNNGGNGIKAFHVQNATFRNNTVVANNYVLQDYSRNTGDLAGQGVGGDMVFHNNLVVQAFGRTSKAFHWSPTGGNATLDYQNNVIVGETYFGRTPTTESGNVTETYDEQGFASFAQIVPDDFEFTSVDDFKQFFGLRADSPALTAGRADLAPDADLTLEDRPSRGAVSAGAFEGIVPGVGPVAGRQVFDKRIPFAEFEITLDGRRDPAYTASPVKLDRAARGTISNDADLNARWNAAYDDTYLYVLVEVLNDNALRNDSPDPRQDDGVSIFIDADNSRGDVYDGTNDFHFVAGWGDAEVREYARNATTDVTSAQRSGFNDYVKEVRIPWTTLGVTPTGDGRIGIEVQVNDDDNGGSVDAILSWQDREAEAATVPDVFGTGTLEAFVETPAVYALPAGTNITLDGELDPVWEDFPAVPLDNVLLGGFDGSDDLSATWRARWSPTFLYLFVSVTDDELKQNSRDWYNDDSVEFFLDAGLERTTSYDGNDRQFSVTYDENSLVARIGGTGQGYLARTRVTDAGYDVEVRMPWSNLGITAVPNTFFGFDVQVNDDDDVSHRDAKLAWAASFTDRNEDPSTLDPSTFGLTYLSSRTTATVNPAVAEPLNAFPNPTSGQLTLAIPTPLPLEVRVTDLQGRPVWTRTGVSGRETLDLGGLPNGNYVLSARDGVAVYRRVVTVLR